MRKETVFLPAILLFTLLLLPTASVHADHLLMVRVSQPLGVTLGSLKKAIQEQGYKVARVDMVNIGLLGMGYTSSKYRTVFFGKAEEIRRLSRDHPQLVPYLPLRIAVFAEGDSTLLVAIDPATYGEFLSDRKPEAIFERWGRDMERILARMRGS